jgi:hypothetical protein
VLIGLATGTVMVLVAILHLSFVRQKERKKERGKSSPEKGRLKEINPLNTQLNPTSHLLALSGARHILHVSRIRAIRRKSKTKQCNGTT